MESPIYYLEAVVKAKTEDLEDFTGPLDLILHLLGKNKMEIKDIQLSLILEQYLLWMSKRQEMDLEIASEFVTMASHLIDIKTRMLISLQDTEAINEMDELIATLEAHRNQESYLRIKKILPDFHMQYSHGQNLLTRPPEVLEKQTEFIYDYQPKDLAKAMFNITSRAEPKKIVETQAFQKIVGREPYSIPQKTDEIKKYLVEHGDRPFVDLITQCHSRSEAIATFYAVLDLCRNNMITISFDDDCILSFNNNPVEQEENIDNTENSLENSPEKEDSP